MSVIITREDLIAYAEVDYIIHHMNERYIEKIPETLLHFFEEVKAPEHEIYIDPYKPLQSQGLRKYTLEIIALLHLKYWCENEERKKGLYQLMLKNQQKLEEQMREKFSIDKLFDNNSVKVVTEESDLEKQDFSKPKAVQYYSQYSQYTENNTDIQDYTDLREVPESEEMNLPEKAEENVQEIKRFFIKLKEKIYNLFHKNPT